MGFGCWVAYSWRTPSDTVVRDGFPDVSLPKTSTEHRGHTCPQCMAEADAGSGLGGSREIGSSGTPRGLYRDGLSGLCRPRVKGAACVARSPVRVTYPFPKDVDEQIVAKARVLNELALARGQSLAQMALAWILRSPAVTSVLIGASRPEQIDQDVAMLQQLEFSSEELRKIEQILAS